MTSNYDYKLGFYEGDVSMTYETLLNEACTEGLIVKEKNLMAHDGRIKGNRIAIRKNINTDTEKACVLSEELGHHYTTTGNILDMTDVRNRKQERHARLWAYDHMIGLMGIVSAYKAYCTNIFEMAEHLEVTETFLREAIETYKAKYGECTKIDNYIIYFEPCLSVLELI